MPEMADEIPETGLFEGKTAPRRARPSTNAAAGRNQRARLPPNAPVVAPARENTAVDLGRLAWLATSFACLIAVLVLVLEGYFGYACVTFAVAVSAAINLT